MSRCDSCRYQNDFEFHACHICHMEKDMYKPKKTNADRIRAMSDKELGEWVAKSFIHCPHYGEYDYPCDSCAECWTEWLKQEAEP